MGNCCGIRSDYIDITRDNKKEITEFNKILNFNWNSFSQTSENQKSTGEEPLTVEEMLLQRITNDNAEFVTPHVAHIGFSEFKKFMYLNKIFIEQEIKAEEAKLEPGQKYTKKGYYVGLFAPPIIDSIWLSLISLDVKCSKYIISSSVF